jgi:2-methylcitrate dehydratase PrpD
MIDAASAQGFRETMHDSPRVTRALAEFVVNSRYDALPDTVRHEGRRAFVNWLGCVLGGCRTEAVGLALPLFDEFSGPREATAIGHGRRLDIFGAAFINGMSSAALSFNDTHLRTVAHPTTPVAAVLLALAERRPVSGIDLLHALILGDEVQCRVGSILTTPPARSHFALSMAALVGGIGASVAAARLLALGERRTIYAIGLAAAQAGGTRAVHGSSAGRMLSGEAARAGLMSALLAEKFFDTPDEAFAGAKGYANAHAENADASVAIAGLGETFEILSLSYKPYPCGIVIHPVIDVCLDLVRQFRLAPEEIEEVTLAVPESAIQLTGRKDPTDRDKAGTSLYHWAASSLFYGTAGLAQGATECVRDPRIISLRDRITAVADPVLAPDAARAEIRLRDGRILKAHVAHARGSAARPLTDEELSEKFLAQAESILDRAAAQDLLARAWRLVEAKDVRSALAPLFRES